MPDHAVQPETEGPVEALEEERSRTDEPVLAGTPVVVRRHAGVAALIGATASAVAIAYLWRASQSMAALDWTLFGVMALVAAGYLASLVDARTPLLVADDLGIRIRAGHEWRGLPWDAIGHVVVHPRRGLLRDGRLVVVPHSLARALDGLDAKGRRHVVLNQKMYGAPLAVPLGLTTRVSDGAQGVAGGISALALGRTEVVELDPRTLEVAEGTEAPTREEALRRVPGGNPQTATPGETPSTTPGPTPASSPGDAVSGRREVFPRVHTGSPVVDDEDRPGGTAEAVDAPEPTQGVDPTVPTAGSDDQDAPVRPARRSILGGIGTIVSRVAKGNGRDVDRDGSPDTDVEEQADTPIAPRRSLAAAAPLRDTRPGLRAEATLDLPSPEDTTREAARDTAKDAGGRELHRPGSVDLVEEPVTVDERIRPISTLGDPVAPLVIDDYVTEPAYDPVIGPEITAARTRLGLSVDQLAERTRIRPHVIESIEVDDFAPCGGDFYARGHLRTLARILGKDPAPLLASFEERYATAPVNARRVFEAELATGMTGSMRSTAGGPNWGLMVGVVIALVLIWGVLRLFTAAPDPAELPTPVINGAAVVQVDVPAGGPGGPGTGV